MFSFDLVKISNNPAAYQLRTKTIIYRIDFDNENQEEIFIKVITLFQKSERLNLKTVIKELSKQGYDKINILNVLSMLKSFNLLPENISNSLDKGTDNDEENVHIAGFIPEQKNRIRVVLFGTGDLFRVIQQELEAKRSYAVHSYEYGPELSEIEIENIVVASDFCIVDASQWAPFHIEIINKAAIKYNKPWLYVGGIEGANFCIGPFFYGRETGCYNCLMRRVKSNQEDYSYLENYEDYLKTRKIASKPDVPIHKDIIYNIVANMVLMESTKILEGWAIPSTWKTIVSINYYSLEIQKDSLLKMPYCEVCNPRVEYNVSPWLDEVTLHK